jgi:hypothetical protein
MRTILTILASAYLVLSTSSAVEPKKDLTTGLIIDQNWELVVANCVQCHSSQQFLRQRGTRNTWQSIVDWMQEDQGLTWLNDPKVEEQIITYLSKNYAPDPRNYRRAAIPATLLPKNPYISKLKRDFEAKKAKETGLRSSGK